VGIEIVLAHAETTIKEGKMPSRQFVLFVLGLVCVVLIHELNATLGIFVFIALVCILLISYVNRAVGGRVAVELAPALKSAQVEVHVFHGGELYKVTLEVIVVREIGAFYDTVVFQAFWQGVFHFADNYPPTMQTLNEEVGNYSLAAFGVLNDAISLRYPKGECRVGTVSVELVQSPANVSVGQHRPG
jgi:hypothetical protein